MVFLGLFIGLLPDRDERIHRKSCQLWLDQRPRQSIPRLTPDPGPVVQFLSDGICLRNSGNSDGWDRGTRKGSPRDGNHVFVDDPRLLPLGLLGMEH